MASRSEAKFDKQGRLLRGGLLMRPFSRGYLGYGKIGCGVPRLGIQNHMTNSLTLEKDCKMTKAPFFGDDNRKY